MHVLLYIYSLRYWRSVRRSARTLLRLSISVLHSSDDGSLRLDVETCTVVTPSGIHDYRMSMV